MSKNKNYTKEQKHLIKQCMLDADIIGMGKYETIEYVKSRLDLDFSESSYKIYRSDILNDDESNVKWITYYARKGFVEFYRKRIVEMEMIQKETFNQWYIETNKPDAQKNKNLNMKLVAELRANNQQLTQLGMVTPIIATIKNLIYKKKDKNKEEDDARRIYPIQYQISREDVDSPSTETDNGTTTVGDSIHNMVPRDLASDEEI
jgi:hypothetical protein